jgi:hypothetical protein
MLGRQLGFLDEKRDKLYSNKSEKGVVVYREDERRLYE